MVFPANPLNPRVDLLLNNVWTNVTSDVMATSGDQITIVRGRPDEATTADTSTCSLAFKNTDGKYSPRNPSSVYYGILGRNTGVRVGVGVPALATSTLGQTGLTYSAPSITAEVTSKLICLWGQTPVTNFGGTPAGFTVSTERDGTNSTWQTGYKTADLAAGASGTNGITSGTAAVSSACLSLVVPGVGIGATMTSGIDTSGLGYTQPVTTAAGNYIVAIHVWDEDAANLMQRSVSDLDGTGEYMLIHDSGYSATQPRVKAYIRRCTDSTVTNVFYPGPGSGQGDTYGATYVLTGVTGYYPRFTGEISSWPPVWNEKGTLVTTQVEAAGIGRRLGRSEPLDSSLKRHIKDSDGLVSYWPMEDSDGSTSFASGLTGGEAMKFIGTPVLATDDLFSCSAPLPTFTAAGAVATVPAYSAQNTWTVGVLVRIPAAGLTDQATILSVGASGGTITNWTIKYDVASVGLKIEAFKADGTSVLSRAVGPWTPVMPDNRFYLWFRVAKNGTGVDWDYQVFALTAGATSPTELQDNGNIVTQTIGAVSKVQLGGGAVALNGAPTFGHVAVNAGSQTSLLFRVALEHSSLLAWLGELSDDRAERLCKEESVPVYVQYLATSEKMGPQTQIALPELLQQCEATDAGNLYEPRGFLGYVYRTRTSKYNQTSALTLSYTGGNVSAPLAPIDDDQRTVNDVTVTRTGGSSARATQTTGTLGTALVGRYSASTELSLYQDALLANQAGWRLSLGTWDEARWPQVHVDLAANISLISSAAAVDCGDRISLTNLPAWVPPGPAELLVEGYTETIVWPNQWDLTFNCSPEGPYRVLEFDNSSYDRFDSDVTTLNATLTTTATSVQVAVASGGACWITTAVNPAEFPFDIIVAGEVMSVTACTSLTSPQTFTVTRSVNGVIKTHVAGESVHLNRPIVFAL